MAISMGISTLYMPFKVAVIKIKKMYSGKSCLLLVCSQKKSDVGATEDI